MAQSDPDPRAQRRAAVATLAAELGHDLQDALNLFRLVSERAGRGEAIDAEDLSLLGEELERLRLLGARLGELGRTPLSRNRCKVLKLVENALRARTAAQPDSSASSVAIDVAVDEHATLDCDPQLLGLALGELLDNALAARAGRAGVRYSESGPRGLCVWDDGPGFALDSAQALGWGVTNKPGAAGLGLTLALRVARAHGFVVAVERVNDLTEVWLTVPEGSEAR